MGDLSLGQAFEEIGQIIPRHNVKILEPIAQTPVKPAWHARLIAKIHDVQFPAWGEVIDGLFDRGLPLRDH